jgi:DNA-binding protein YbaB
MFDKAKKMFELRKKAMQIQKELRELVITEEQLGGKIRVSVDGEQKVQELHIDEELFKPEEKATVEKHLKMALSGAMSKAQQAAANKVKSLTGGDLSGLLG